jgi:flagellar hook protein FlgE
MDISAIALQGLDGAQGRFESAASKLSSATLPVSATGDTTDLSQSTVDLLSAKNDFEGNLKVVQVADEMERTTIDMLA